MWQIARPIVRASIAAREEEVIGRVEIDWDLWEVEYERKQAQGVIVVAVGQENSLEVRTTREDLLTQIVTFIPWVDDDGVACDLVVEKVAVGREWTDDVGA